MAREIERKFLVHLDRLPEAARTGGARLTQGYLSFSPSVRVRLSEQDGDTRAWLTIKGSGRIDRDEFEYEIPVDDARSMLAIAQASLSKVRHLVPHGDHVWEVDQFTGAHEGFWMAEIELEHPDEPFLCPDWIDREVSDDPRYTNAAMARAGCAPAPTPDPASSNSPAQT
jgi:adenylate cyclase